MKTPNFSFRTYFLTYLLITVNVVVFLTMELSGNSSTDSLDLLKWGANFNPYTFKDQWWRLITSAFLHIGVFHLLVNMYSLYMIGRDIENRIGSLFFLFLYLISSVAAGLASGFYNSYIISAGASGAIFGIYGFDIVSLVISHRHDVAKVRSVIINFVLYLVVITVIGASANFDNAAHIGGLIAGVLIALIYFILNAGHSFNKLMIICISSTFSCYYFYSILPRDKVQYFDAFQLFLEFDRLSTEAMNKLYDSDSLMVRSLEKSITQWDSLQSDLDSIHNLSAELLPDKTVLKRYSFFKQAELSYIITSIRQESYIYFDSLGFVRNKIAKLPKLEFPLNMTSVKDFKDSSQNIEGLAPMITQYYDSTWRPINQPPFEYVREGRQDSLGRWEGWIFDYYKNGRLQMKGQYNRGLKDGIFIYYDENNTYSAAGKFDKERKIGKWEYFHYNGELQSEVRYQDWVYTLNTWDSLGNSLVVAGDGIDQIRYENGIIKNYTEYKEGQPIGPSYGNHKNGKPYFYELYENGRLVYGKAMDLRGNKVEYDVTAYFSIPIGGWETFDSYVASNKQYPDEASKERISGELEVVFMVYANGDVGEIRFINELGYGCEEEAERLLLNGPKWKPPLQYGLKPVSSDARVMISFP